MGTATQPGTAVVRTVENTNVPLAITESEMARTAIEPLLPKGVTLEQVGAQVRLALAKDKSGALKKCTVGSVILSVAKIVAQGLEVGVTAHLVPYGTECQALRDYTGDIQLAIESGMVRRVSSQVVYANEPLTIKRGSRLEIEHHPVFDPKQRGEMVGVYAILHLRGGDIEVEYMTYEEVDAIRQAHSKSWKQGRVPRWYMKKTCIRQALKLIPKTPKLAALLARLEAEDGAGAQELDAALAMVELPSATRDEGDREDEDDAPVVHRIGAGDAVKPLSGSGDEPYDTGAAVNAAPEIPGQFEDSDELFSDAVHAPRRPDALREG